MTGKMKFVLPLLAVVLLLTLAAVWFLGKNEPTASGPSPRGIAEHEALNLDISTDHIANIETCRSDSFTGVYEVFTKDLESDRFELLVNSVQVNAGEFKMELLLDGEVVHTFANNQPTQRFLLQDATGRISLRITGEGADFTFDYYIYSFHIHSYSVN